MVGNPWLALPMAFASHFVCDVIPHFDVPGRTAEERMESKAFLYVHILSGAVLCGLLVLGLAITHPFHWLLAAFCAFIATSPDLLFIPRYIHVRKTGQDNVAASKFWQFHNNIQWFQRPIGALVEVAWAGGALILLKLFIA